jgi:hypothetical protein
LEFKTVSLVMDTLLFLNIGAGEAAILIVALLLQVYILYNISKSNMSYNSKWLYIIIVLIAPVIGWAFTYQEPGINIFNAKLVCYYLQSFFLR